MPVLETAAQRAAHPATCLIHNLFHKPQGGGKTMGCPVCVFLIRRDVRHERANAHKWLPLTYGRKPQNCVPVETSEPWPR